MGEGEKTRAGMNNEKEGRIKFFRGWPLTAQNIIKKDERD